MRQLLCSIHSLRVHASRLREPLVQVWLMTGMALVLVIMGHVHAVRQSGRGKNPDTLSAARLLTAGASFQWSDHFAPAVSAVGLRPALSLLAEPAGKPCQESVQPLPIDWRGEMTSAAGRPWKFLGKAQRQFIGRADRSAGQLPVALVWSGGPSGNAALSRLECQRLGKSGSGSFVIGNGSRSRDGELETAAPLPTEEAVTITLIGSPATTTDRQKAALGELLNYLEARFGTVNCRAL